MEAKVAVHNKSWLIAKEYEYINDKSKKVKRESDAPVSNLFVQLYHKKRLVSSTLTELVNGVDDDILPRQKMKVRKIGNNRIVKDAAEKILKKVNSKADIFYLAIVPQGENSFKDKLDSPVWPDGKTWESWEDFKEKFFIADWRMVKQFCAENKKYFERTLDVFKYNSTQIYFE